MHVEICCALEGITSKWVASAINVYCLLPKAPEGLKERREQVSDAPRSTVKKLLLHSALIVATLGAAIKAEANDKTRTYQDSIANSKNIGLFLCETKIEPSSFTTFGRTYSIREAWLERFGLRNEDGTPYQDNFYFLCFSLEKIPSPIPETEVIRSVQFRDAQNEQRVVEGYGSSKTTKKKGVFRIKQETDHLIVYGFPCKTTAKRIDLKVEGYQLSPDSLYEKQITPTDVTLTITIPEQFEKLPSGEGNAHPHTKTVTQTFK